MEVKKSRNLTVDQLFNVLQEEYLVCMLRYKIYPIETHKEYWYGLMNKKKEKIIHIARKNNFLSIFDDNRIYLDFYKRIIPDFGFPRFIYKDDHQRLLQEKWDIHNYYLPKSKIKVIIDGEEIVGTIEKAHLPVNKVIINVDGILKTFDLDIITRIIE